MGGEGFTRTGGRFPPWLRKTLPAGYDTSTRDILRALGLNTVCRSAECPNLGECWHNRTATFLICGDICTRNCAYCAVRKGAPEPLDPDEPLRVAEAARRLGLRHVVVTSVTRDDLPDGGAAHFAATIRAARELCGAAVGIEVLIPDFGGSGEALADVLAGQPDVFNHNIETVARLFPAARPQADYARSLRVLEMARRAFDAKAGDRRGREGGRSGDASAGGGRVPAAGGLVKSGLMVGMGETPEEVAATLRDLRSAGCDAVTIGQYLSPSTRHLPVAEYVPPERFGEYADIARSLGFRAVASGPFVRSSYRAAAMLAGSAV
ncbi:MAG: lipoyl synthase [Planctomycetota bacterium]|nr:lipoyl synthase [Planctomycetota bacterium]